MSGEKRIALVAHDNQKNALSEWVKRHESKLAGHKLWATGTTGGHVAKATGLTPTCLLSGPKGGDQQLGAMIAEGKLDILIFFTDPLTAQPHDVDVKALLRISTLYQVAVACNEMTADYILSSSLMNDTQKQEGGS